MKYVAYYRVSTREQGASGLGLSGQYEAVSTFVENTSGTLVAEYQDIESGSNDDRPQLQKALRKCRLTGATLLIAKLDRLSRNRRFLMEMADSSTKFICCDMPEANNFTVGLLACLADYERQLISERTKAALSAAKAKGTRLGNPRLHEVRNTDTSKATAARSAQTAARNSEIRDVISEIQAEEGSKLSSRALADRLNSAGYTTSTGGQWHHQGVLRVLAVS